MNLVATFVDACDNRACESVFAPNPKAVLRKIDFDDPILAAAALPVAGEYWEHEGKVYMVGCVAKRIVAKTVEVFVYLAEVTPFEVSYGYQLGKLVQL